MRAHVLRRRVFRVLLAALLGFPGVSAATTSGAPMPWDTGLQNVVDNLTGPTARLLVLAAIVVAGLMWAFTEHGSGARKFSQIVFGAAIALGAVALLAALGITGAVVR